MAVLYTSDYGYSDRLSQTLAKGITKAGVKTEMVDVLSVDPQVGRGGGLCVFWGVGMQPAAQGQHRSCCQFMPKHHTTQPAGL